MPHGQISFIGELVKSIRKEHGWSQEEFAGLSGVGVRTIQRIEAGEKANIETLRAIATVMNLDVSTLIPLNDPIPGDEFARLQSQTRQQLTEIEKEVNVLPQIQNGKELLSVVASFSVLNTDYPPPSTREEGDAIAAILATVRDYADIHEELDPHAEIETVFEVGRQLEELNRLGLTVFAGKLRGSVVFPALNEAAPPTRFRYGAVFIRRSAEVKTFNDPNSGGRPSARFRIPFGPVNLA
jgi:transcriptional regulator with XRE-family HTH domain